MNTAIFAFLGNLGIGEIVVILLILLLVFGAKRIPEIARSLGKASREFKDARDNVVRELEEKEKHDDPEKKKQA